VVGIILVIFTSLPAIRERRSRRIGRTTELSQ
jgi:hypothetical protein